MTTGAVARLAARHPRLAHIVDNVGWLLLERVATLVVGLAVNLWFVRYLGPERYGVYAYGLSYTALFAAVAALGLDTITVREIARAPQRAGEILGTVFGVRALAGIAAYAIIVVSTLLSDVDPATRVVTCIVAASVVFTGIGVFDFWFRANVRSRPAVIARTAATLGTHLVRCALILAGAGLGAFAVLFVASAAATAGAMYLQYRRDRRGEAALTFRRALVWPLVRDAWPLVLSGLAVTVYMRLDQVMLGRMTTNRETGIYATAVTFSELFYFIPSAVAETVFPYVVQARDRGRAELAGSMQVLYDAMAAGCYLVALAVALLAGPVVTLLLGPRYAGVAGILQVHVWTLVFVALGSARHCYLVAENLTKLSMVVTILGGLLNAGLNLLLIPRYGGMGSAWATLAAQAFAAYLSGAVVRPLRGQFRAQTLALLVPFRLSALRDAVRSRAGIARPHPADAPTLGTLP